MQSARLVDTAGCLCSHHPPTNPDYECVFVKDLSIQFRKRSTGLWLCSKNEVKKLQAAVTSNEVGPKPSQIGAVLFECLVKYVL